MKLQVWIHIFPDIKNAIKWTELNDGRELVRKDLQASVAYWALDNKRGQKIVDARMIARCVAEKFQSFQHQ